MLKSFIAGLCIMLAVVLSPAIQADAPEAASVNGKYSGLIQVLTCPADADSYGQFRDYGWWGGGSWCGQSGQAGYWVWVNPSWYVWRSKNE